MGMHFAFKGTKFRKVQNNIPGTGLAYLHILKRNTCGHLSFLGQMTLTDSRKCVP